MRVRREYNAWVANETMEDYALRFAPRSFRKWSAQRVAATAFGSVSFLALEAIGGAVMVSYGFTNAILAMITVALVVFLTALPISYYAARYSVDMDLLARGAGFGYIGSTITSLIYASFTFIFFALEAAIMALVFDLYFKIPLAIGYLISSIIVVPMVMYGVTFINRLQWWTTIPWLVLSVLPFIFIVWRDPQVFHSWTSFTGYDGAGPGFDPLLFGMAATVCFSLIAQVGEQVDFLRFLPERQPNNKRSWWMAMLIAGPGWIVPGLLKQMAGALLAFIALQNMVPVSRSTEPTQMYLIAWNYVFDNSHWALAATTLFVVLSQIKINVTNAYAGSLAWSNFFSRVTHSHPGRVVWLFFNVLIAVLLMEIGVFGAIKQVLGLYSCVAIAWVGALVADLVINKPLGLSPRHIEFRRAYLHNINPVGVGATVVGSILSITAFAGTFGEYAQAFAPFIALLTAMVLAPILAWWTDGKYYIAREPPASDHESKRCSVCENTFEAEDMAMCPAYGGHICSLCCTLDARCHDMCKRTSHQQTPPLPRWLAWTSRWSPTTIARVCSFSFTFALLLAVMSAIIWMIYYQQTTADIDASLSSAVFKQWAIMTVVIGVASWWLVLNKESRQVAEEESTRQNALLQQEIEEHRKTDAALQRAKEAAEHANSAKSRFLASMSHEMRTPLNSIIGYAQFLYKDASLPVNRRDAVATIRDSGEHLLALVDESLDIARIEAGRFKLRPVATEFTVFLTQIVNMFRMAAERKGTAFRLHVVDQLPRVVRMDQQRVRQILLNLIGNAVKFTREGEVSIQIRYSGEIARIHVSDTGPGIAQTDIERIFQPFQRAQNTPQTDDSTGLGLTISRMITEQMGGELTVDSEVGKGSVFKLRLFLPEVRGSGIESPLNEVAGYKGVKRRILLVDDQYDQRAVLRNMLDPLGFATATAANGEECLRLVNEYRPDVILLDLSMPGMNGLDVCSRLRERAWLGPIIVISANVYQADRERVARAGCDGFVAKPVMIGSLLEQLQLQLALEWVYGSDAREGNHERAEYPAIPPPGTLLSIREHARIGYVKGITEEIDHLYALDSLFHPYADRLRELARQFRTAEIITLVEETLSNECATDES